MKKPIVSIVVDETTQRIISIHRPIDVPLVEDAKSIVSLSAEDLKRIVNFVDNIK